MDLIEQLSLTPHDPELINHVRTLLEQNHHAQQLLIAKDAALSSKTIELRSKETKIAALTMELAYYRRIRFGSKSEALHGEQRELFEETCDADLAAIMAELEPPQKRAKSASKHRTGRQPLPAELPRIEHRHEPESCQCGNCGKNLVLVREDISEQLDVEPARFFVHRYIRPQYACRACETITAAPIPPAIIDGGMAAPGLLAWVAISKFADHLPLYRLEQIAARQGVPLARSTMAQWVGQIGVALQPLSDRLAELLRQRAVLHADETPVRQLDPGQGKTRTAYLWAYRSNRLETGPPIAVFDYQISRAGSHVRAFLAGWQGHLMVDDYAGYKSLFGKDITELACLAHVRRKFFDLHAANGSPIAAEAIRRIAALYAIEQLGVNLSVAERAQLRQTKSKPMMEDWHTWLTTTRITVATGSATAKAMDYAMKRWPALRRYVESGALPIDNNPVENMIRPIAIGKKNWMFTGSERAGRRAAAIQSLLATAKLNGLEPLRWLTQTLERLPTCPNSQLDSLLPFSAST